MVRILPTVRKNGAPAGEAGSVRNAVIAASRLANSPARIIHAGPPWLRPRNTRTGCGVAAFRLPINKYGCLGRFFSRRDLDHEGAGCGGSEPAFGLGGQFRDAGGRGGRRLTGG